MIIGLQIGLNSGIAVYDKGKIIYASSEERFTRIKNDSNYPENAISNAKEKCCITSKNIEKVILVSEKMSPVHFLCNIGTYSIEDYVYEQNSFYKHTLLNKENKNYLDVFSHRCVKTPYKDLYEKIIHAPAEKWMDIWNEWRVQKVSQEFDVDKSKICIMNHEFAHAAYGIYGSYYIDYDDVMCVVYDGFGDSCNASVYIVEERRLKQVHKYDNFNIGRLYRYITLLLGMKPGEHEFKVMGLAPYGNKHIYKKPLEVFRNAYKFVDGEVIVDPELKDNFFYFKERLEGCRFDGIAAGLQILTEEMNCSLVDYWMKKTHKTKCVISGGVSLNIKANMEVGKLESVKDLYVVGSAGDESLCIGAIYAYLDSVERGCEIKPIETLYFGDDIERHDIEEVVAAVDTEKYLVINNPTPEIIAEKIGEGAILGRAVGKMEFGARALGNRSILADPRERETIERINAKIKSRDFWMPFTPSILEEDKELYLDNPKNFRYPFMSVACETTELGRQKLKAAIHPADKTARPQLVTKEANAKYYDIINAFKNITGVGALLNTSLNLHGYPIVRTAKEAFKVMDHSDLDGLILDGYLIIKR